MAVAPTESDGNVLPPDPADLEGRFDDQLALPLQGEAEPRIFDTIVKRNGQLEPFDKHKIAAAIFNAAESVGGQDRDLAESLANAVTIFLSKRLRQDPPTVDQVHDAVERVLIQMSHARTALAYARYRDRRARIRRLRDGDMRALLSELVEAQHTAEVLARQRDHALLVRTQTDIATWNRERIVEALVRETGLDRAPAMMIALEVEQQIDRAGLKTLTASLVRELVGAKLVEHGFEAYREPYRRLGISVYDCGRILRGATEDTVATDPEATDRAIAWTAKREYALTEVFSSEVVAAHFRGALHLHGLERPDRLLGLQHDLRAVSTLQSGAGLFRAVPPEDPEVLLGEILRWQVRHECFVSGWTAWEAFNVLAAPFLKQGGTDTVAHFAQRASVDFAYHWLVTEDLPVHTAVVLHWNVPAPLNDEVTFHPGAGARLATYGAVTHTAQQLAWAMIEHARHAAAQGIRTPSPELICVVDDGLLRADGGRRYLEHAASAAAEGAPITFRFDRPDTPAKQCPVAHRVSINLPQLAYRARNEQELLAALDHLLALAFAAHEEKYGFLALLMDPEGQGPLRSLAQPGASGARLQPEDCAFQVAVDGLYECIHYLRGGKTSVKPEADAWGEALLAHARVRCEEAAERLHLNIVLTENTDPAVSERFAGLDLAAYPESARATVEPATGDCGPTYTPGVGMRPVSGLPPVEFVRRESRFKGHLAQASPCRVRLPMRTTDPRSIAGTVQKCFTEAPCPGVIFEVPGS
ncbi:MAG: hypothetical protein HYV27_20020 [Candidatus Hydrogenedentes bacterium]|nr:hypothetical protein [Candidatus Hydrogenedentota bacterium]